VVDRLDREGPVILQRPGSWDDIPSSALRPPRHTTWWLSCQGFSH